MLYFVTSIESTILKLLKRYFCTKSFARRISIHKVPGRMNLSHDTSVQQMISQLLTGVYSMKRYETCHEMNCLKFFHFLYFISNGHFKFKLISSGKMWFKKNATHVSLSIVPRHTKKNKRNCFTILSFFSISFHRSMRADVSLLKVSVREYLLFLSVWKI